MSSKIRKLIICGFVAVWAIGTARASVIYTYTGNPFTSVVAPYTTSDFVSMILTFADALPGGLNNTDVYPTAVTMSDGQQTLTMNTPGISSIAAITTNAGGAITGWTICLYKISCYYGGIESQGGFMDQGSIDAYTTAVNYTDSGLWMVSNTSTIPEPSSVALSALALTALMWTRTRRSFRNPKALGTRLGKAA